MIEIHLYGTLRLFAKQKRGDKPSIISIPVPADETITIAQILQEIGIPPEEAPQIFLNRKLLRSPSPMTFWLGYPSAEGRLPESGDYLDTQVSAGDRLGIFPPNMAMLVI